MEFISKYRIESYAGRTYTGCGDFNSIEECFNYIAKEIPFITRAKIFDHENSKTYTIQIKED